MNWKQQYFKPLFQGLRSIIAFFFQRKAQIEGLNLPKIQIPTRPGMKMTLSKFLPSRWTRKATITMPATHPSPAVSTTSHFTSFLQVSASLHAYSLRHCFLYVATRWIFSICGSFKITLIYANP